MDRDRRLGLGLRALAIAVGALLAMPAGSEAVVTLGAVDVSTDTGTAGGCSAPCTRYNTAVGSGGQLSVPFDGVIVRWRLRKSSTSSSTGGVRLRVLARTAGSLIGKRSGPTTPVVSGLNQFAVQLPIAAGETIGFDTVNPDTVVGLGVYSRSVAGAAHITTTPLLADGETRPEPPAQNQELLFNADVERDADCDGLGDESQDPSIGTCPVPAPPPAPDATAPTILGEPSAKPAAFVVNRKGKRETAVKTARRGTTFGYVLSEPASVTFALERTTSGRKVGRKCRRKTRRNRARKRCPRYTKVAAFRTAGVQGENRKSFSGRVGKISLRPARYRALLTAVDAAGNRSKTKRLSFKVLPARRR